MSQPSRLKEDIMDSAEVLAALAAAPAVGRADYRSGHHPKSEPRRGRVGSGRRTAGVGTGNVE